MSFLKAGTVSYVPTPNRRENFTIAHEIGHWLVYQDDDAPDWIAELADGGKVREQLCDQIAGQLLIPDALLDTLLDGRRVEASDIARVSDKTAASEPACAIAIARRLHTPGAVVLLDQAGRKVSYASVIWDDDDQRPVAYPWKGQTIPNGHPLLNLGAASHIQHASWWSTPWGDRHNYYLDAIKIGRRDRIAAVFAETDLWDCETLHLDRPSRSPNQPSYDVTCECGFAGRVNRIAHEDCGQPFCPGCETCGCKRKFKGHTACKKCTVETTPHDLVDGVCSNCR